jgi:UDP-N-acetylmuramoyl-L-alanyl-D-glutamate--2,6-diaminopimelate ligase
MEGPARVLLHDLVDGITPLQLAGDPAVDVRSLVHDSRRVAPGACFACVPGSQTDGHAFAPQAVANGAVALLVERPLGLGISEARVPDVRLVLGPLAARLAGEPSRAMRCLGVTGTNGKTTTTYLLRAIAEAAGERTGLVGTTGAHIGSAPVGGDPGLDFTTPEATDLQPLLARMRDDGVQTVALEVSSHALAQHRIDGTYFAAACFTNLSHDHLDFHGDVDAYFAAKASLFDPARCAVGVVNLDDPRGAELVSLAHARGLEVRTFAVDDALADYGVEELAVGADGSRFIIVDRRGGERVGIELPLLGRVNASNALAAAATYSAAGGALAHAAAGLARAPVVPGRLERVDAGQPFAVLVDYAHTPDALEHALATARELAAAPASSPGRVAVVFGCGGDRDVAKRPEMGAAAAVADLVMVTNDNPRSEDPDAIADAASAGVRGAGAEPRVELDRRAAIRAALEWARPGDVVLVAGKGHETGQTIGDETFPFDDRKVAREELARLGARDQ